MLKLQWILLVAYLEGIHACGVHQHYGRLTADCRGLNLTHVPQDAIPLNTTDLLLGSNNISRLYSSDLINLHQVKRLVLATNPLQSIAPDSLEFLSDLEELDLSDIPMKISLDSCPPELFANNTKLKILQLPSGTLPPETISHLPQLEVLRIQLSKPILPKVLADFTNLKVLDLSHGNIGVITKSFLDNIRNSSLQELTIINAGVRGIEPGAFSDFSHLHTINLACNRMPTTLRELVDSPREPWRNSIDQSNPG